MSPISSVLKLNILKPVRSGRMMTSDWRTLPTYASRPSMSDTCITKSIILFIWA